jgi:selenide,water dikinase
VTGFGLIGHAREMAIASGVMVEIDTAAVQFLPGAVDYARQGAVPGGLKNNREFASCAVEMAREIPAEIESLLYDPQTSGGLLISMAERDGEAFEKRLPEAYRIGQVLAKGAKAIRFV